MGGRELDTQGSFICMMSEYELGTLGKCFHALSLQHFVLICY